MLRAALILAIAALPLAAQAQSFRCVGKDGKKYYGSTVPPQCLGLPVEQLNDRGVVIKRIDAAASADERAKKEVEEADSKKRAAVAKEQGRKRLAALAAQGGGVGLTPDQASKVFTPLLATRDQEPPLAEVYQLIAEVWTVCTQAPTRTQLSVLEEGVRTFPHRTALVYRTAELNVRHGFTDTARWLITLGLTLAPDAAARARFEALQAQVNAAR